MKYLKGLQSLGQRKGLLSDFLPAPALFLGERGIQQLQLVV